MKHNINVIDTNGNKKMVVMEIPESAIANLIEETAAIITRSPHVGQIQEKWNISKIDSLTIGSYADEMFKLQKIFGFHK